MASAVIHICVAKKINEVLKRNEKELFLGTIAPDISKQIGETKVESHFLPNENIAVPILKEFLAKYQNDMNNAFTLGYYIHLFADKMWFEEFTYKLDKANAIKDIDGNFVIKYKDEITEMVYQDYTNLNVELLDYYDLDLSLFYEELVIPKTAITEIPMDKLQIIVDQMGIIIQNSKVKKEYFFDIEMVTEFVDYVADIILKELERLNIIPLIEE